MYHFRSCEKHTVWIWQMPTFKGNLMIEETFLKEHSSYLVLESNVDL